MLHITINLLLITSAFFVFFSENSVHSIIFLVVTFLNASVICFLFGADFLGLILIIIYVGAIAILFLFVVMLLNVKTQVLGLTKYFFLFFLLSLFFVTQMYAVLSKSYLNFHFLDSQFFFFESLSNDFFLSQVLYNYFLLCFLISGLILLVGMIGAIVLTLNFNRDKRREHSYRQLSRSDAILSHF